MSTSLRIALIVWGMARLLFAAPSVEFWHSMTGGKGKLLQEIVAEYNRLPQNQGKQTVRLQFVGSYTEGLNKLRTSLLAGRGPHVAQILDTGTQVMIDSNSVVPLQDFIDRDPSFPSKEFLPAIRRYYETNSRLQSLPFSTSNPILYFNKQAFKNAGIKNPPATYAELRDVSAQLTDPKTRRTGLTWPLHSWFLEEFLAREGVAFAEPNNGRGTPALTVNFTSPEAIGFVTLWADLVKAGSFANVGRGWEPAEQNFLAGRSAMLVTSTSEVFEIQSKASFPVGTAPIPSQDRKLKGGTVLGGNSLWLLKGKPAAETQSAYEFLKYMASKPVQRRWHSETGYFPIRADVIAELKKEGFYQKNPNAWTAIQQLQSSQDMPATRGALLGVFPEAREHVESAIESVLAAGSSAGEALAKAKIQTEAALTRYQRLRSTSKL